MKSVKEFHRKGIYYTENIVQNKHSFKTPKVKV